jgi:hypothetical protein
MAQENLQQQSQQHIEQQQTVQQVTQQQQISKLDELDLNQQINQNNCVYIECAPLLEIQQEQKFDPLFVPASQHQQPSLTQINYNVQSQNHLQLNSYNLQGVSQVQVYNGTYTMPLQPMQPANILHNQVIAPQMQIQHQQQLPPLQPVMQQQQVPQLIEEDKDKVKKNGKVKRDSKLNETNKQCPTCNKIFATSTKLSRHMKTHSTDMPYKCKVCNKAFSHSGNYKIHLRMHTDERPFRCTVCDKGCRQAQDLEKHMRTHTGIVLTVRGQATTDVFAVRGGNMSFFFIASVKKAITKRIFCAVIEIRVLKETSAIYFFKVDIPDHSITKIMSKQNEF